MGKLPPADPRKYLPSRAHPEHRSARKELEKQHPFGWKEPLVLGMIGISLAWDIEKQVRKHEERKERKEREEREYRESRDRNKDRDREREREREDRHRRGRRGSAFDSHSSAGDRGSEARSRSSRGGEWRGRSCVGGSSSSGSSSDRSVARDTVDLERSRRDHRDRDRVRSVDVGRRDYPRYIDDGRYYEPSRYDRGYDDGGRGREGERDWDRAYYNRGRRDSW